MKHRTSDIELSLCLKGKGLYLLRGNCRWVNRCAWKEGVEQDVDVKGIANLLPRGGILSFSS